jgi:hypothetical protein
MNRLRWTITITLLVDIAAHAILLSGIGAPAVTVLAFLVTVVLAPGLLVTPLFLQSDRTMQSWPEQTLLGFSSGFALFLIVIFLTSYLPGPLARSQLLVIFNLIVLVAAAVGWFKVSVEQPAVGDEPTGWPTLAVIALISVLLVTGYFRLVNLDYSELQGDESKVLLHAVSVVQGDDDVLFLHRRGPVDVLPPAAVATLGVPLTEAVVRIPFAVASLLAVGMIFLLGRSIQGLMVAWLAGMLLASEGLFIAFARIVQYQAFIHLSAVCTLFILFRLYQIVKSERGVVPSRLLHGFLLLAALFLAAGLLTHYEAVVAIPPAAYLLWRMVRDGLHWRKLAKAMIAPALGTLLIVLAFYVPFILDPRFQETLGRYSGKVVGGFQSFYNHLPLLIERASFYNFYGGFLAVLVLLALYPSIAYFHMKNPMRWLGIVGTLCMTAAIVLSMPITETYSGWTSILVGIFLIIATMTPRSDVGERLLWLWLAPPMFLSVALILDPNLHFYNYFAPLSMLAAIVLNAIWIGLRRQLAPEVAITLFGLLLAILLLPRTFYAHQLFIYNQEEIQRNWQTQTRLPAWMQATAPDGHPIFGFPHNSGWKTVGMLYQTGVLRGSYNANVRDWITAWYTRGAEICEEDPEMVFIELVERPGDTAELLAKMDDDYVRTGQIQTRGRPGIDIYTRTQAGDFATTIYDAADFAGTFDAELADADFHLMLPELDPALDVVHFQFGEDLILTGYWLYDDIAKPGESLSLALRWQVLNTPSQGYTLFAQVLGEEARKIGQRDRPIDCNGKSVHGWEAGDEFTSHYRIPLVNDADPGEYPLFFGIYGQQDRERLPILDEEGQNIGDAITLTQITVAD